MADERLFLLELLVDKITFTKTPCFSDEAFQTCVNFEFLDNQSLEVTASECLHSHDPHEEIFKTGKSCMFPLKESDVKSAIGNFNIKAIVSKLLPCGCLPKKIELGRCDVDMSEEFDEAQKESLKFPDVPISKSRKDSFKLKNIPGDLVGEIYLFLRISCFGKIMVTKFQREHSLSEPFAVTHEAVDKDKIETKRAWRDVSEPCHRSASPYSRSPTSVYPVLVDTTCGDAGENGPCNGNQRIQGRSYQADTDGYCLHVPTAGRNFVVGNAECDCYEEPVAQPVQNACSRISCGDGNYEEIGASFNGNEVKIRVPKHKKKIQILTQSQEDIQNQCKCEDLENQCRCEEDIQNQCRCEEDIQNLCRCEEDIQNLCGCDEDIQNLCRCNADLKSIRENCSPVYKRDNCGGNKMSVKLPDDMCNTKSARNDLVFHEIRNQYAPEDCRNVTPSNAPPGVCAHKINIPDKDVFILKIGKQANDPNDAGNIEVELVTPKGPPKKVMPKQLSVQVQAEPEPEAKSPTRKKRRKGKGKKGKKGKKAKKGKKKK